MNLMARGKMQLKVSGDDEDIVGYLSLPDHSGQSGVASKQVRLIDLLPAYTGPDIYFDFDKEGVLIGIEILP